jgi:hypothetical protein
MQCFQVLSFPRGWIVGLVNDWDGSHLNLIQVLDCVQFEETDCEHWPLCYVQEALLIRSLSELWHSGHVPVSYNPHIYNQLLYNSHLILSVSKVLLLGDKVIHSACKGACIHDGFCSSHFFFLYCLCVCVCDIIYPDPSRVGSQTR